jgi:peptide deformylase
LPSPWGSSFRSAARVDAEMPPRTLLLHPDLRLRAVSEPVEDFDDGLRRLVEDLRDTLLASASGIGLSAPQIGELQRVILLDLSEARDQPEVYVNPEILSATTPGIVEESCLSIPGVTGKVLRSTEVRIRAQDVDGGRFERDLSGMHAVCFQHEVDHLEGRLFIDRLSWIQRLLLRVK